MPDDAEAELNGYRMRRARRIDRQRQADIAGGAGLEVGSPSARFHRVLAVGPSALLSGSF
ncbi:hypothetical protein Psi02_37440 [Planotetraspora silvatica]|uniref:Uncharacterized protein n=1 Tax=Planotetraspora silvatica TaxID=234614 RepID=A0A8J3UMW6_9ACTN|nr:hypothetical protein Psi02_37440 [Planotetraspora silvatica]